MSQSAAVKSVNLPAQPLDESFRLTPPAAGTPAWKQEINQKIAAHRTRRGGSPEEQDRASSNEDGARSASGRAAEAAARVAARYAKAPSYKQLLAGEARAVVRAAGAAAEAARNAQAAAQAVLTGLEFGPEHLHAEHAGQHDQHTWQAAAPIQKPAPARWQDEPPAEHLTAAELAWREYEAIHGPQHFPAANLKAAPESKAPAAAPQPTRPAGIKPRWEESLPVTAPPPANRIHHDDWSEMRLHPSPENKNAYGLGESGAYQYDLEGYGSQDPIGDATVQPMQHIAANLIEFPKELVAARKARPRQAEGPYYDASKEDPQLSIFEVDPDLLAPPICLSDTHANVAPPEWASIELNHRPSNSEVSGSSEQIYANNVYATNEVAEAALRAAAYDNFEAPLEQPEMNTNAPAAPVFRNAFKSIVKDPTEKAFDSRAAAWQSIAKLASTPAVAIQSAPALDLQVAPLSDRILAGVVDGALVTLAFLAAAMVVVASTDHPPAGKMALVASIFGLMLFGALYQFLFFSYSEEGTPGMRYARVALCSFEDDNPCREQIRKRIPALMLSALPIGLGLAWAFVDGDGLAWHDRLTRTYQRKY